MENGFEVFISFKNTDKNGERTQDSIMAEELYYALKEKGIRAFYINVSISERGEHRFGKMIREAIEQCSIFVAVGTSIENFESEWVEYERESFHDEMMNGNKARTRSAMFSYITRNVSTNKLPMELRRCQAFYELKDVVSSICTRIQNENEVIHNFKPQEISIESLSPGTLVDGKYEILQEIGRGGMSVVYLAMDTRLHRPWAVKVVRKEGVHDFEVVKLSLLAEIDIMKSFDHPNLPRIVDVIDTKESFVIIMDYIEGKPLNAILEEQGAQSEELVVTWAKQLCDVLKYLHTHKSPIIYRDLKPANIMLKHDGQITLIDFGTARQYKEHNLEDTTCLGTLGYAAPEQFGGMGQTDPRTDIYCLGVTMYHLVTGKNPAEPPYELYPIRTINPQLSYGLEYIIAKCIRRNPEERYQSVAEVKKDLDDIKRIDAKCRRKGFVKAIIDRIFSKKDNLQEKTLIEEKNTERKQSFETPIIPIVDTYSITTVLSSSSDNGIVDNTVNESVFKDTDKCGVIKKSTLVNLNTVNLCDRVAVCISTKNKAIAGEYVNIYFATEAIKSDVVGLIASNKGYTMLTIAERIVDINLDDNVKIQIDSEDLFFSTNEFEFLWKDYITQKFYQFLSFQINKVLNTEESILTVHLYVNNKNALDVQVVLK